MMSVITDKTETVIAKIISYLFHPFIMPTAGLYLVLHSETYLSTINSDGKFFLLSVIFVSTCLLPVLSLPFFYYKKMIKNFQLDNRTERIIPAVVSLIFYMLGYYLLKNLQISSILIAYISAVVALVSIALLITIWWKISLHTLAIGGLAGTFIAISVRLDVNMQHLIMLFVILFGVVSAARIKLKSHNILQTNAGFVIGTVVVFLFIYFS